jgi:hypothetical protein
MGLSRPRLLKLQGVEDVDLTPLYLVETWSEMYEKNLDHLTMKFIGCTSDQRILRLNADPSLSVV